MKTVRDFLDRIKLNKTDKEVLYQHVEECRISASGPSLEDKCTDRVRRYLRSKPPPPEMSWQGTIKLEDALNQGFSAKQAYKMGIPSIGIVAVLVANVTFIAWATPPGGATPFWLGCDYPMFTGFLIINGCAFILSVASAVVVTAFPLVLSRTPHQAALWGGILLMMAMLCFIAAFLLAGFITVGYKAPAPSCSSLGCTQGGVACQFLVSGTSADGNSTVFVMDNNVAALNHISNSSSGAVCLTYNRSISHGPTSSTLYPWSPPPSTSGNRPDSAETTDAINRLLTDQTTQLQTVCMDVTQFPTAIDPSLTLDNLTIDVNDDVQDLGNYLNTNDMTLVDLLPNSDEKLQSYYALNYFCMSNKTADSMQFDVLCDSADQTQSGNLSVGRNGDYIRAVTAANSGATVFDPDLTAEQVSKAIKALGGVFAFICLVIIVFLVKSKWF